MRWTITTDPTFDQSLWKLHVENTQIPYIHGEDENPSIQFDEFLDLVLLFLEKKEIQFGTWEPMVVDGRVKRGFTVLQIPGNPFQAYFKTEGRPKFTAHGILALRAPPTDKQLEDILNQL